MSVVGLDLSLTATGICDVDGVTRTVTTPSWHSLGDRLHRLVEAVVTEATREAVLVVVIEDFVTGSPAASTLGMVHGAVRLALWDRSIATVLVAPATLKKYATGRGNAPKPEMRMALYKRTGLDLADDNQVDAWWLRAAGLQHLGTPVVDLPAAQLDALGKVAWP